MNIYTSKLSVRIHHLSMKFITNSLTEFYQITSRSFRQKASFKYSPRLLKSDPLVDHYRGPQLSRGSQFIPPCRNG